MTALRGTLSCWDMIDVAWMESWHLWQQFLALLSNWFDAGISMSCVVQLNLNGITLLRVNKENRPGCVSGPGGSSSVPLHQGIRLAKFWPNYQIIMVHFIFWRISCCRTFRLRQTGRILSNKVTYLLHLMKKIKDFVRALFGIFLLGKQKYTWNWSLKVHELSHFFAIQAHFERQSDIAAG